MEMLRVGVASELWVVLNMMGMCACVWGCVCTRLCVGAVYIRVSVFVHAWKAEPSWLYGGLALL